MKCITDMWIAAEGKHFVAMYASCGLLLTVKKFPLKILCECRDGLMGHALLTGIIWHKIGGRTVTGLMGHFGGSRGSR